MTYSNHRWIQLALVVAVAFCLAVPFAPISANRAGTTEDWPQYRGPHRDGISTETGWLADWPKAGPKTLWKVSIGTGFCTVSVVENRVYTMGHDSGMDTVFCLDADTGKEIWKHTYECPIRDKQHEGGPASTPAVTDKYVFTLSREADFYCLDVKTGEVIWYKDLTKELGVEIPEWAFSGSPLLWNNWVIVDMGVMAAFEMASGNLVWKTKDYGAAYSSPAPIDLDGRACVAVLPRTGLAILDAKNGKEVAFHEWKTKYDVNAATPLIIGNKVFISSGYNRGCALVEIEDGKGARALWENKNMRNHFNSSVHWKGYLYGFDDKDLACLDVSTGETKWSKSGFGKGSLTLSDGKLIILSDRGELVIAEASAEGFKEVSRAQVLGSKCWTVPVLAGHRIYARNAPGDLVCVDVGH